MVSPFSETEVFSSNSCGYSRAVMALLFSSKSAHCLSYWRPVNNTSDEVNDIPLVDLIGYILS